MITKSFIIAMAVLGVWKTFRYGHIFHRVAEAVKWAAPELGKPLFDCMVCMVPWYGLGLYLVTWGAENPINILVTIIASMGINCIAGYFIEVAQTLNTIVEYELSKGNSNTE